MPTQHLTFFRFLAASIVIIYHFGRNATDFRGILISGPQMVTFFFVLSGFVMGISYLNRDLKYISYLWARISRILPVYLLAISLILLQFYIQGTPVSTTPLILNLTLLQSWWSPYPLSINGPGWSLSVEAFFYLMFPFILYVIKKYNLHIAYMSLITLSLWLITQIVTTNLLSSPYYSYPSLLHDLIYYFPPTHLCSFMLGILGAMTLTSNNKLFIKNNFISFFIFIFSIVLIVYTLNNQYTLAKLLNLKLAFGSSLLAPLFLIFILLLVISHSKYTQVLNNKILILLGEASYALYILQFPIYKIYNTYLNFNISPLIDFISYFIFLTVISIFVFLFFEKPSMQFIRYTLPNFLFKKFRNYIKS